MSKVRMIEEYRVDRDELIEFLKEKFKLKDEYNWNYDVYFDNSSKSPLVLHRDVIEELK